MVRLPRSDVAAMMLLDKKGVASFIGQWAPSLLVIGVYNKLVKVENELLQAHGA
ncbi:MAG: hypothetical protein WKG00_04085 [Polyangiaceae bacterium]